MTDTMFNTRYRDRAIAAEAEVATLRTALAEAAEQLHNVEIIIADRNTLINIDRNGRRNVFTFVRSGEIFRIETIGTWDDDIDQWKRELL